MPNQGGKAGREAGGCQVQEMCMNRHREGVNGLPGWRYRGVGTADRGGLPYLEPSESSEEELWGPELTSGRGRSGEGGGLDDSGVPPLKKVLDQNLIDGSSQVSYLARDTEFPVRWMTVVAAEARADAVPTTPVSSTIESSASTDNESNSIEPSEPWRPPGDREARPEPEWVTSGDGFPLSLSALSRDVARLVGCAVTGVVAVGVKAGAGGVVTAITVPRGVWPREGGAWLMLCRWGVSLVVF